MISSLLIFNNCVCPEIFKAANIILDLICADGLVIMCLSGKELILPSIDKGK